MACARGVSPRTPKADRSRKILISLTPTVAIYHFKSQIIKRSAGRSATATAAYRAREKIKDERTGLTFDYRHISPASHCQILAPDNAPSWVKDRSLLWNAVEKAEKRKDSQVAREIMVALPSELSRDDQIKLGINFIQNAYVSKGMVADLAFHDLDKKNPHLHVMLTTRKIDALGFGLKERDWNPKFKRGQAKGDRLEEERQLWQDYTNRALERAGYSARVDCRSLADRGLDRVPQIHLGARANNLEKKGIRTARGDEYRSIAATNKEIATLKIKLDITQHQIQAEKELKKPRIRKQQQELKKQKQEQKRREREQKKREKEEKRRQVEEQRRLKAEQQRIERELQAARIKAEIEARKKAEAKAKAMKKQLLSTVLKIAELAVSDYGKQEYSQRIFKSSLYRIEKDEFWDNNSYYGSCRGNRFKITERDTLDVILEVKQYSSGEIFSISNNLTPNCAEHFEKLQALFKRAKRIREFADTAQTILWKVGKLSDRPGISMFFEGKNYQFILEEDNTFKVAAKDGRGEILKIEAKNNSELTARSSFTDSDFEYLKTAKQKILKILAERNRALQNQRRQQKRNKGRGRSL